MRRQQLTEFLQAALECSVYLAPKEPGLTPTELVEAGRPLGFQEGEIGDVLPGVTGQTHGDGKLQPIVPLDWDDFLQAQAPDYRNIKAFDFACSQLRDLTRSVGAAKALLDHAVIVQRGVATGIAENDLEVAIAILVKTGHLSEKDGVVRFSPNRSEYPLPSEQTEQVRQLRGTRPPTPMTARAQAYPIVSDVIARRTDGRPRSAEALDAFAEQLGRLGYGPFRLWWTQTVAELRHLDASLSPVATSVLAGALVEGALTFVVKHARGLGVGAFGSTDFSRDPRTWKIDDLVASATTGRDSAILDTATRHRADALIKVRQRIHAGGMLSEYPAGVPDLRPEEARDAKATAELVVRRVLDWLGRYPIKSGTQTSTP
jgi:hypothetical protein